MAPVQKKFVKYTFDEGNNSKPRQPRQTRQVRQPRERQQRQNFKQQRENNQQGKGRRSYTEKPVSRNQNILKDMINSFVPIEKPSAQIQELTKRYSKYFNSISKQPQPFSLESLNSYLIIIGKKPERETRSYAPILQQSQQDPDWDSQSDHENGIQSRKIDEQVFQKAQSKLTNIRQLRNQQLKRHEKQFLQDYYRQKHQEEAQRQQNSQTNHPTSSKQDKNQDELSGQKKSPLNNWSQYQQKQVNDFVNMGIIQKIQGNQDGGYEQEFGDEDFSVQDQKSEKQASSQSSQGDNDIFGDQGPTTIVKKKQALEQGKTEHKHAHSCAQGTVVINTHVFSRVAQGSGVPPRACIWIIRNKNQRYRVSTQFMDEMYRLNKFSQSLPYISLNHSQFVHNNDVQKQKGLAVFKNFNARKQYNNSIHHQTSNSKNSRNYDNNKRKQQYKPNTQQPQPTTKSHLNKK